VIIYADEIEETPEDDGAEDYPVNVFISREGYLKKITPISLRMSGEQKYKDGDGPAVSFESTNRGELLVFTDRQQAYKARLADFEDTKASVLGVYLPSHLGMDDGEQVVTVLDPGDYKKHLLFFFANGKAARIGLDAYETKTNRKRLVNAYSDKSPLAAVIVLGDETDLAAFSTEGRAIVFGSTLLAPKTSRTTQGVAVMTMKAKYRLERARPLTEQISKIFRGTACEPCLRPARCCARRTEGKNSSRLSRRNEFC
jgi:DNA gyrase subunit A